MSLFDTDLANAATAVQNRGNNSQRNQRNEDTVPYDFWFNYGKTVQVPDYDNPGEMRDKFISIPGMNKGIYAHQLKVEEIRSQNPQTRKEIDLRNKMILKLQKVIENLQPGEGAVINLGTGTFPVDCQVYRAIKPGEGDTSVAADENDLLSQIDGFDF